MMQHVEQPTEPHAEILTVRQPLSPVTSNVSVSEQPPSNHDNHDPDSGSEVVPDLPGIVWLDSADARWLPPLTRSKNPTSSRCIACHDLHPDDGLQFEFHVTDLVENCTYCDLLRRITNHYQIGSTRDLSDSDPSLPDVINLKLAASSPVQIEVRRMVPVTDVHFNIVTVASVTLYQSVLDSCPDLPLLGINGNISPRADSEDCFGFIMTQMKECLSSHPLCPKPSTRQRPRRVLHIGSQHLRLLEDNWQGPYAALSHCWGNYQPLRTTQENKHNMMQEVSWADLSLVFQDAVQICRRLKIEHLWIDSLCIVQDSSTDWEAESGKMCEYYENATVTIAAASSPNGTTKFLQQRDERWLAKVFSFKSKDCQECYATAREVAHEDGGEDIDILTSRAWAWQEAILSARTIRYAPSAITWVCKTKSITEDGCQYPRRDMVHSSLDLSSLLDSDSRIGNVSKDDGSFSVSKSYGLWQKMVDSFATRNITFAFDRLPALSGVASKFQPSMKGRYLAGHWEFFLIPSLCWAVTYVPSEPTAAPSLASSEYVAPTWSWASMAGNIRHFVNLGVHSFKSRAEIVEVSCLVPGMNPFGRVYEGYLVLRGPAVQVSLGSTDPFNYYGYNTKPTEPDIAPFLRFEALVAIDCFVTIRDGVLTRARDQTEIKPFEGMVWCVLLGEMEMDGFGQSYKDYYVLILGLTEGKDDGSGLFRRLGLGQWRSDKKFQGVEHRDFKVV